MERLYPRTSAQAHLRVRVDDGAVRSGALETRDAARRGDRQDQRRTGWNYEFGADERLRVYLTNTLEQATEQAAGLFGPMRIIAQEADAASEIKRDLPIMVVLGNPPYSGHSANASRRRGRLTWIGELIEDYKKLDGRPLGERNPKWLQDDYVKFIRFGQWRIQQSGAGIMAFITNHSYLDNPTFRGMRQQLKDTFSAIYLLDLHGNALKKERAPDGGADKNVFDIQQGVAIAIFVKEARKKGPATVHHADLWGEREYKYEVLSETDIATTKWERLEPNSPNYLFKPWDSQFEEEWMKWKKITEIMPVNSVGVVTARDELTIHWSADEVMHTVRDFASLPTETARDKYNLGKDARDWKVNLAQEDLNRSGLKYDLATPMLYRPFDTRYTYYTGKTRGFICMPRQGVMRHMLDGNNLGLITCRQESQAGREWSHSGIAGSIIEACAISNKTKEINYLFPLYTYPAEQDIAQGLYSLGDREPNLAPDFVADMERSTGLQFVRDGKGDLRQTFGPEDVLHYIYAVFHSPTYRERYAQFLRYDFPRVPTIDDVERLRALVGLGRRMTDAHLMRSSVPDPTSPSIGFPVAGDNIVEKAHPKYYPPGEKPTGRDPVLQRGRVYISSDDARGNRHGQYFEGVSPEVWKFRIGGYQPLDKWLKDRKGRALTFADIAHYRRIYAALERTIDLMAEIDEIVIDAKMLG